MSKADIPFFDPQDEIFLKIQVLRERILCLNLSEFS